MGVMNGGQGGKVDRGAATGVAQRAPELEPLAEIHLRPPGPLAPGEFAARQHRVVGAHPASQRHLEHHQRGRHPQAPVQCGRQRFGTGSASFRLALSHRLHAQQGQQTQAAQQVQRDDRREQLHRDRQRTERALRAHPEQCERGPPGADAQVRPAPAPLHPTGNGQGEDQHTNARGQIPVNHLNPGFAVRDWAGGHGALGLSDVGMCSQRAGLPIAARPVGAAQSGVGEPGERAEQDQVEGQEQRQQGQGAQAPARVGAPVAHPDPGQRPERDHHAHGHQARQRCEVVQDLGVHGRVGPAAGWAERPGLSQALAARSIRSMSRLALAAPAMSSPAGKRIIQLPSGSTRYR